MVKAPDRDWRYSVVVPVCNEASVLARTLPPLLAALAADGGQAVFVCNGCTDASAALIRAIGGAAVAVVETPLPGKARALNLGDAAVAAFPRFYLDADVLVQPDTLRRLARALEDPAVVLVAPRIVFDLTECSLAARGVARTWAALPHAQGAAFHHLLGLSRAGRARWGDFPAVTGDDLFIEAMVPQAARGVVTEARITTWPPRSLAGWVRTRSRWMRGARELVDRGLSVPRTPGQGWALLRRLVTPRHACGAAAFVLVRLAAAVLARGSDRGRWYSDRRAVEGRGS